MASVMESLNPLDPAFRRNPYDFYAAARAEGPVLAHPLFPVLSCFRYEQVNDILRDGESWSTNFILAAEAQGRPLPAMRDDLPPSMLFQDGAEHARLRGLVNMAFTQRVIRRLDERMVDIADDLLDEMLPRKRVDLIETLAHPLPLIVIAEMIGVPLEDRDRFKKWSDFLVQNLGGGLFSGAPAEDVIAAQIVIIDEMRDYFKHLADLRRTEPRDDLLSGLVAAEVEGSKLTHDEMLQMLILLLVAGNETTRTLIGNVVIELLDHPDAHARLRAEPELMPTAIDEVLRHSAPIQLTGRRSVFDQEVAGYKVKQHDIVMVWIGSANRDETVFDRPDHFDITRDPNRHLSFGLGPHYCLGANLARLEAQVAVGRLLERTRAFERVDDDAFPLHPSFVFNAVSSLPLRIQPA